MPDVGRIGVVQATVKELPFRIEHQEGMVRRDHHNIRAQLEAAVDRERSDRPLDRFGDTTQSTRDRRFDTWGLSLALSATFN